MSLHEHMLTCVLENNFEVSTPRNNFEVSTPMNCKRKYADLTSDTIDLTSDTAHQKKLKTSQDETGSLDKQSKVNEISSSQEVSKTHKIPMSSVKKAIFQNFSEFNIDEGHHNALRKCFTPWRDYCIKCDVPHGDNVFFCYRCGACPDCTDHRILCHCGECWGKEEIEEDNPLIKEDSCLDGSDENHSSESSEAEEELGKGPWNFDFDHHIGHCDYITLCEECVSIVNKKEFY